MCILDPIDDSRQKVLCSILNTTKRPPQNAGPKKSMYVVVIADVKLSIPLPVRNKSVETCWIQRSCKIVRLPLCTFFIHEQIDRGNTCKCSNGAFHSYESYERRLSRFRTIRSTYLPSGELATNSAKNNRSRNSHHCMDYMLRFYSSLFLIVPKLIHKW